MITYNVQVDEKQVSDAVSLFEFLGGNSDDALRVAINRTAPKVQTKSSAEIRGQVRLTAGYVKDKFSITRATRKNLTAAIKTPSRGLLLTKFSTDTKIAGEKVSWILPPPIPPRGIKVKVKPSGASKSPGSDTFYMVLPGTDGALAIARRRKTPGPKGGKIDVLYGPSLSQVFNTVRDDVLPFAGQELEYQLLDAMRYLLQKQHPVE